MNFEKKPNARNGSLLSRAGKLLTIGIAALGMQTTEPTFANQKNISKTVESSLSNKVRKSVNPKTADTKDTDDDSEAELDLADFNDAKKWGSGTILSQTETQDEMMKDPDDWNRKTTTQETKQVYSELLEKIGKSEIYLEFERKTIPEEIPAGYEKFREENLELCKKIVEECKKMGYTESEKKVVELTEQIYSVLSEVNEYINSSMKEIPDPVNNDDWPVQPSVEKGGDCEDKMIAKMRKILEVAEILKIPITSNSFSFTIVKRIKDDNTREGHAILTFHATYKGKKIDLVMDNLRRNVHLLTESKHEFLFATGPKGMQKISIVVKKH